LLTRGVLVTLPAHLRPMLAQTNKGFDGSINALHRTAICAWGLPWSLCLISQFVAVGELGR